MPTNKRDREYYRMGYADGQADKAKEIAEVTGYGVKTSTVGGFGFPKMEGGRFVTPKTKRKLSAWQKFVKVNSKKPRFRYKSGSKKGKINLKALGVAYRKKRR